MISRRTALTGLLVVAAGCATPGQVRRVETQLLVLRTETARRDSVRAADLARIIRLEQSLIDSLNGTRQAVRLIDARVGVDLTDIQRAADNSLGWFYATYLHRDYASLRSHSHWAEGANATVLAQQQQRRTDLLAKIDKLVAKINAEQGRRG